MARHWGVRLCTTALLFTILGLALSPVAAQAAESGPAATAGVTLPTTLTFTVTGVVDGMTYYAPVSIRIGVGGPVDPTALRYTLDDSTVYSSFVVSRVGTHVLRLAGVSGGVYYSKVVTFTIASPPSPGLQPVFRFYRRALGTHFFTNSHEERDSIVTGLAGTYSYEGIAYWTNPSANQQPLYRFFRPSTGTHFYTASDAEMQNVRATLSRTYTFEGPAYNVTSAPAPGATVVWRFFNRRNGTHFYTADENEKNAVLANLGGTYSLDGQAFWLAQ